MPSPEELNEGQLPEGVDRRLGVLAQAEAALRATPEEQDLIAEAEAKRIGSLAAETDGVPLLPKRGEVAYDQENL